MNNLIDIQNQIANLQKQAEEIKAQEFDKTVQEIMAKMAAFGITLADLDAGKSRPRKAGCGQVWQPGARQIPRPQRRNLEWSWFDAALAGRLGGARAEPKNRLPSFQTSNTP